MSLKTVSGCMRIVAYALLTMLLLPILPGQSTEGALSFEVASVKPSAPGGLRSGGLYPGGRLVSMNVTLRLLIEQAYGIQYFQHKGGPSWLDSATFDVVAQAGRGITNEEASRMLQSLLADRFKLAMHEDARKLPGYILVVGKSGSKLQEAKRGPGIRFGVRSFGGQMSGPASMQQLAAMVGSVLQTPVVDKTGLQGYFDFSFPWRPEARTTQPQNPPEIDPTPSLFTSLEELGLKLEPQKDLAPLFIIDRAERPSEN
jgi:uncharacterized protein (TIGR03435 family)